MPPTLVRTTAWWLFAFLCLAIGLYPAVYFLGNREFGLLSTKAPELLQNLWWNIGFYGHIIPGGVALLIGWIQFSQKIRLRNPGLHRNIGLTYVCAAVISATCGIFIGFFATGGPVAASGFIALGSIWLFTTLHAYRAARMRHFDRHETWMTYSYAACFAAVTLRIWLPVLSAMLGEFVPAYRIVAWLCWVPNLAVAHAIRLRKGS